MTQYITYTNQGAIRNKPLSQRLIDAFSFLPEMGVSMNVFSGGQAAQGSGGPRTGSTRHDHGDAADVFFRMGDRRISWQNPNDIPVLQEIVRRAKAAGVTGFGAGEGYMQPGSMHVGFGTPAIWGRGNKSANAPAWLREAYGAAPAPQAAAPAVSSQGVAPVAQRQAPAPAGLLDVPQFEGERTLLGGYFTPDRRDHLIAALEGMTLNPNVAMMQAARDRTRGRAEGREKFEQEKQAIEKTNKTIEWLNSQGRGDLAQAVASGAISGGAAAQAAMAAPEARKGVEINGRLVDPVTGALIADFSDADGGYQVVTGADLISQLGATPEGVEPGALYNVSSDGKISRVGGGGTTVNVGAGDPKPELLGKEGLVAIPDPTAEGGYRIVPAPGSPAEKAEAAAASRVDKVKAQAVQRESIVGRDVDRLVEMIDKDKGLLDLPEAGIVGGALGAMGVNQEAVDFKNTLQSIQATIAFDTLQKMREASKTGGALGSVSEKELALLISVVGALDQTTSGELLKQNLLTIKEIMGRIENDPIAGPMYRGEPPEPAGDGFSVRGVIK